MESVDSADNFGDFQRYMHIERYVEKELKDLLLKLQNNTKSLILLCGSVGDGKSHMLAYFKNKTNLLDGYNIINDATESKFPNRTSKECLAENLLEFSDENISNGHNCKTIMAINLGTLSNFLEAEESCCYSTLKEYVNKAGLLSVSLDCKVDSDYFFNINFANYQMYELTKDGIKSDFLTSLFKKVFLNDAGNPFFVASQKCDPLCKSKCPVYANFKLLMNEKNRAAVIELLENSIVSEKLLLSTRAILNLIYDIIVAPIFENENNAQDLIGKIKTIQSYLEASTPFLLFEKQDRSSLLDSLAKQDPMRKRKLSNDELSITFNYSDNLVALSNDGILNNVYFNFIKQFENKTSLRYEKNKYALNKLNVRMRALENGFLADDESFKSFVSALYYYNIGKKQGLKDIYTKFKKAIYKWNGLVKDEQMVIPTGETQYTLSQSLKINNDFSDLILMEDCELNRFKKNVVLNFKTETGSKEIISVDVDYKLYLLIDKISTGYRPNINDKYLYVNFNEVVGKLIKHGEYAQRIMITENAPQGKTFVVERSDFDGFIFTEVKDARY